MPGEGSRPAFIESLNEERSVIAVRLQTPEKVRDLQRGVYLKAKREPKFHFFEEQLSHMPATETRNRKPLEQPAALGATWELRFGLKNSFRVFYDVNLEEKIVSVLAIGVKEGNQLFIDGQEFEL